MIQLCIYLYSNISILHKGKQGIDLQLFLFADRFLAYPLVESTSLNLCSIMLFCTYCILGDFSAIGKDFPSLPSFTLTQLKVTQNVLLGYENIVSSYNVFCVFSTNWV